MPDFRYTPSLSPSSPPSALGDALDAAERLGDPELQRDGAQWGSHPAVRAYRDAWLRIFIARTRRIHPRHPRLDIEATWAIATDARHTHDACAKARAAALAGDRRHAFDAISLRNLIDAEFRDMIAHEHACSLMKQATQQRRAKANAEWRLARQRVTPL